MSVQEILAAVEALPADERREVYTALVLKSRQDMAAQPSADDLAQHLIGTGSGLTDVSSNKAYLRDLGEGVRI